MKAKLEKEGKERGNFTFTDGKVEVPEFLESDGGEFKISGKKLFQVVLDYNKKFNHYNTKEPSQNLIKKKDEFFKSFKLSELDDLFSISASIEYEEMNESVILYLSKIVSKIKSVTEFRDLFSFSDDMKMQVKINIFNDLKYLPEFVDKFCTLTDFEPLNEGKKPNEIKTNTIYSLLRHIDIVSLMIFRLASIAILQDIEWSIYKRKLNLIVCKTCRYFFLINI